MGAKHFTTEDFEAVTERHLTIKDLAEREGVPVSTIYQWNSRGLGPRYMSIGRHVRYKLADVLEWEASRYADRDGGGPHVA